MTEREAASSVHIVALALGACVTAGGIVAWSGIALVAAGLLLGVAGASAWTTGRAAIPARWMADGGTDMRRAGSRVMAVLLSFAGAATAALGAWIIVAR